MDKTLELSVGRSGVRIPGRGKSSLRTTAVDARVKYPIFTVCVISVLLVILLKGNFSACTNRIFFTHEYVSNELTVFLA